MDDRICHEYTIGFCTRKAFYNAELTQECTKIHDNGRKHTYNDNIFYEYEVDVYNTYKIILNELERKIKNKNAIINSFKKLDGRLFNEIDSDNVSNTGKKDVLANNSTYDVKNVIDIIDAIHRKLGKSMESNAFNYALHNIYGKLIFILEKCNLSASNFTVCEVCSNFIEKEKPCDHPFHDNYLKLKQLFSKLSKKFKLLRDKKHRSVRSTIFN